MARTLAASIARRQSRGLVDAAAGMTDVVIHGRVNLQAVAEDMIVAASRLASPVRQSWAAWFTLDVEDRRELRRREGRRRSLAEQARSDPASAPAALARLRMRELED